ncbi:MAG: tyrosine-type recombinase/integrase, partial [Dehalococcoidia bacterium]|nr:tyrosine-type recombinase/integrase [Dehalococcoidia bacterium]
AAANLRDRLLVRLLFHLGCRVSEALGLTTDDVDFAQGTVRIRHLKARTGLFCPGCNARLGRTHTFCPKCGRKAGQALLREREQRRMRALPLDPETMEMLQDYIRRGGPICRDGQRLIFGINRHRAWQIVTGCAARAGLGQLANPETGKVHKVSPQRLRDAFAVHAVKADDSGDGLRLLQQHLGHRSFDTTARYRKVAGEEHRQWYERLWRHEAAGKEDS